MIFCSFLPPVVIWPKIVYCLVLFDDDGDSDDAVDDGLKVRTSWSTKEFIPYHMYKKGHLTIALVLPLVLPVGIPLIILAARGWI